MSYIGSNLPCLESEEATEDVGNIVLHSKEEEENVTTPVIITQNSSSISKIERRDVIPSEKSYNDGLGADVELTKQLSRNSSQSSESSGFKL